MLNCHTEYFDFARYKQKSKYDSSASVYFVIHISNNVLQGTDYTWANLAQENPCDWG